MSLDQVHPGRERGVGFRSLAARFAGAREGTVAVVAAVALPVLLVGGAMAIDLSSLYSDRVATQDIADAAAVQGANQLSVEPSGAEARAQAFADAQLTDVARRMTVTVTATKTAGNEMTVAIDTHRLSFFANLLPPGGFHTHVQATARTEAGSPLCVLTTANSAAADDMRLDNTSRLDAPGCSVQANRNIAVNGSAAMQVAAARAGGSASGPISPSPEVGAQTIADPFASLPLDVPTTCNSEPDFDSKKNVVDIGPNETVTLQPGLHCYEIQPQSTSTIILAAGTHYFKANFDLKNKTTVDGTAGVTLVFLNGAQFAPQGNINKKTVNLVGQKTGALRGFVIATPRGSTADFTIPADAIDQLTGAIYVPDAKLIIDGSSPIAKPSPWTVVVAKGLDVTGSADLFINSNYAGSDVPLPASMASTATGGRVRLAQ